MQLILELENKDKLQLILDFIKDFKDVKTVKIVNSAVVEKARKPDSLKQRTREEAIQNILRGCEFPSFGDGLVFQKEARKSKPLPFRD